MARFDAAANPKITYKGLEWSEFEAFIAACIELEETLKQFLLPEMNETLFALRRIRRKLRTLPINPRTPTLRLVDFIGAPVHPNVGHDVTAALKSTQEAATQLLEMGDHPAARFLAERVELIRASSPDAVIHVVVSKDSVADLRALDEELNLGLSVTDLTGAKRVDIGDVCFVFGSPESLLGAQLNWIERSEADRAVAWLFNAPIAREVCVVSWPGNRAFKVDRYAVFPGSRLEITSSTGRTTFRIESLEELPVLPSPTTVLPSVDEDQDSELVEARVVQMAGGIWTYYALGQEGPRPDRISESDFELIVEDVPSATHLKVGDRLVIRDGDASRDFLDAEANAWLREKHGKDEPSKCQAVRDRFRNAMQELAMTPNGTQILRSAGFGDAEIQYRFRLSHDRAHIAPEDREVYERLCTACDFSPDQSDWDHIRHLRSALKRAGRKARQQMEKRIALDDSWMDIVDSLQAATIDMADLGSLVISFVLVLHPEPVKVPLSRLGIIHRSEQ